MKVNKALGFVTVLPMPLNIPQQQFQPMQVRRLRYLLWLHPMRAKLSR